VSGQFHAPGRFIPRERAPGTHWIGICLFLLKQQKIFLNILIVSTYLTMLFPPHILCSVECNRKVVLYSEDGGSGLFYVNIPPFVRRNWRPPQSQFHDVCSFAAAVSVSCFFVPDSGVIWCQFIETEITACRPSFCFSEI